MNKLANFLFSLVGLICATPAIASTFTWVSTSTPPNTYVIGSISFEPGQESVAYNFGCGPSPQCSGTIGGVSYAPQPSTSFIPVSSFNFRVDIPPLDWYYASFDKTDGYGYSASFGLNGIGSSVAYAESGPLRFTFVNGGVTSNFPGYCSSLCGGYWSPYPVPVPATIALLGLGLVGIGSARRKQA